MNRTKRGMLAVAGCGIAVFCNGAFIFGFPGVMGSLWAESFQVGRGAIGSMFLFILAAVGILMFLVGKWQERIGIRRMITIGAVLNALDVILAAYVSNVFMLYLWAFIIGAASCFIYLPGLTTVQKWFPERRGLVAGFVNMMFGISGAIMAPVFTYLLSTIGYFSMTIYIGIIAAVLAILAAQFTEVPEKAMKNTDDESEPQTALADTGPSLTARESLGTRSFWCLWLTWALQGAAGVAMVMLSREFGFFLGHPLETAVVILTAFNITNGLSRIISGFLSDIVGRQRVMSISFLAAGVAYFILPHVADLTFVAVLAALIGFAFGTLFAVSAPLTSDCFGMKHFGAIFGLIFTAYGFVAAPLGPSLSGFVLDLTDNNFLIVFSYLGIFCAVSSILITRVVPAPQS